MNIEKMSPLEAIQWYVDSKFDLDSIKDLVDNGIVDTDDIARVLNSDADPFEFVSVPDLAPTEENLKLLVAVGVEIMTNDRENAEEWARIVEDFDLYHDELVPFREANRAPGFTRKLLELFERHGVSDRTQYDYSMSYTELARRIEGGVDNKNQAIWDELGVSLESAIAYGNEGLEAYRAKALVNLHGIDRKDWLKYRDLPDNWIRARDRHTSFESAPPNDWATIDELLDLRQRGYKAADSVPWQAKMPGKRYSNTMSFTLKQAQMLADAGMTTEAIARMWDAGATSGRRHVDNAPPHILPFMSYAKQSLNDGEISDLIAVYKVGVRAAHLNEYRWAGAYTLDFILQAVAAGITPARVKYLRDVYGWTKYYNSGSKRIQDIIALLAIHASVH
jgi:hypothetical protein